MTHLHTLTLASNRLTTLPSSLGLLTASLTTLHLASNPFSPTLHKLVDALASPPPTGVTVSASGGGVGMGRVESAKRTSGLGDLVKMMSMNQSRKSLGTPSSARSGFISGSGNLEDGEDREDGEPEGRRGLGTCASGNLSQVSLEGCLLR